MGCSVPIKLLHIPLKTRKISEKSSMLYNTFPCQLSKLVLYHVDQTPTDEGVSNYGCGRVAVWLPRKTVFERPSCSLSVSEQLYLCNYRLIGRGTPYEKEVAQTTNCLKVYFSSRFFPYRYGSILVSLTCGNILSKYRLRQENQQTPTANTAATTVAWARKPEKGAKLCICRFRFRPMQLLMLLTEDHILLHVNGAGVVPPISAAAAVRHVKGVSRITLFLGYLGKVLSSILKAGPDSHPFFGIYFFWSLLLRLSAFGAGNFSTALHVFRVCTNTRRDRGERADLIAPRIHRRR